MKAQRNFIAGHWTAGVSTTPNIIPSDTRDVLSLYARADQRPAVAQVGKALVDASGDVLLATPIFKFFDGEALRVPGELLAGTRHVGGGDARSGRPGAGQHSQVPRVSRRRAW